MQKAKMLREAADYYDDWSPENAKELIDSADELLNICKKILAEK
ncbi:MAG: hypothetical protein WCK36_05085 [Candidatus Firestonebacteria bacterium]